MKENITRYLVDTERIKRKIETAEQLFNDSKVYREKQNRAEAYSLMLLAERERAFLN